VGGVYMNRKLTIFIFACLVLVSLFFIAKRYAFLNKIEDKVVFNYKTLNPQNGTSSLKTYNGNTYLEIVAKDKKEISAKYTLNSDKIKDYNLSFDFLSHAGFGEVNIRVLSLNGDYSFGWVVYPKKDMGENYVVLENIYTPNYIGAKVNVKLKDFLQQKGLDISTIKEVDVTLTAADGQHLILLVKGNSINIGKPYSGDFKYKSIYGTQKSKNEGNNLKYIKMNLLISNYKTSFSVSDNFKLYAYIKNISNKNINGLKLTLKEPYGYGVIIAPDEKFEKFVDNIKPNETKEIVWNLIANRSNEVNLNKSWDVEVIATDGNDFLTAEKSINIIDKTQGKIFYVMTEDLEAMDSAGYDVTTGNRNGWLDPEEIYIQMVEKPNVLNDIANKYGAKWTHFIAYPLIDGANWVSDKMIKNNQDKAIWKKTISEVIASMIEGVKKGNQYTLHTHMDYSPEIPWNYLSYDINTNGFWANHNLHGWAHSLMDIFDINTVNSRAGSIAIYQGELNKLYSKYYGQPLTLRMGSFDFGDIGRDTELSTTIMQNLGIYASSDARQTEKRIYFADKSDINKAAGNFNDIGMIELSDDDAKVLKYEAMSINELNSFFKTIFSSYTEDGNIKPGIHLVLGFTHAMFMMGNGGWKSVNGGNFALLDEHLKWVKDNYIDKGKVQFATADEVVKAYLNYYTPRPIAVYGVEEKDENSKHEYPLTLLGSNIPYDKNHVEDVIASYPIQYIGRVKKIEIYNGDKYIEGITDVSKKSALFRFKLDKKYDDLRMIVELEK
jgi:hypothetical protein